MFYTIFELYCKDILKSTAWDVLSIKQEVWCRYKKASCLPDKHFKFICESVDVQYTFDEEELSHYLFNLYWEKKNDG
jgi:hypothetical protein